MKIYDITGSIKEGIWAYTDQCNFTIEHTSSSPNSGYFEIFHDMNSQTGTYLETTAHVNGYNGHRLLSDVPVEDIVNIPCRILHFEKIDLLANNNKISVEMLQKATSDLDIPEGCAILLDTGWYSWYDDNFLSAAPCLSRAAMEWILKLKPSLLGSDTPAWQKDEKVFDLFGKTDTLLLAPLVDLNKICGKDALLTVLPIKMEQTCCAPARAIVIE